MKYNDLRSFLHFLESKGELKRIQHIIDPNLEMTEIADRTLNNNGPALLFENPKGYNFPVLCNLFGTTNRIAMGLNKQNSRELIEIGNLIASLMDPNPPNNFYDFYQNIPNFKKILNMATNRVRNAACHDIIFQGDDVDITKLPIMKCWPSDAAPLITWGLTVTRGTKHIRQNIGVYRQQIINKNRIIIRWLAHRGGALDYQSWLRHNPKKKFPVTIILGADPATILSAVIPIPNNISEYSFAGLLRGKKTKVVQCLSNNLFVPANSEIILEGYIIPGDTASEGPHGDHTGYYNEISNFPVLTITHITHRRDAIYHSTYTGRPPDEPAIISAALNEIFLPIIMKKMPEIIDFYLPVAACSYRLAIVSINKQYLGHAKQVMFGIWSFLKQFMYTKFIIVCDADINIRNWNDVLWAIATRMDPMRDTLLIDNTAIDYLDFASPISGLGSKMGLDATNKWPGEIKREWGKPIIKDKKIILKIDSIWNELKIFQE